MSDKGYKIRLNDGSEIGPMDIQAVKDWHAQGLIGKDNLVMRPGGTRWSPLREVLSLDNGGRSTNVPSTPTRASSPPTRLATRAAAQSATPSRESAGGSRGSRPWRALGVTIAVLAVIAAAVVGYRRLASGGESARAIRIQARPDRGFADAGNGVSLTLPDDWIALRPDQTIVATPSEARFVFAQPKTGAVGYLTVETATPGVFSVDQYLDRALAGRQRSDPSQREVSRRDTSVGRLAGRALELTRNTARARFRGFQLAVRDGWSFVGILAWYPEGGSDPAASFADVKKGFACTGSMAAHLDTAVKAAATANPHLSPRAVEFVMGSSEARVLTPETTFRRAFEMTATGLATLKSGEARELGDLNAAAAGTLSEVDRLRLMTYLQRLKERRLTATEQDREMASLMMRGVSRLSNSRRARLQALYEKAIRSAINQ